MQLGGPLASQDAMKIAWRYQNLPKVQVNTSAQIALHVFTPRLSCTSFVRDKVDLFLYFFNIFVKSLNSYPSCVANNVGMRKNSTGFRVWQLSPPLNPSASKLLCCVNGTSASPFRAGPDYSHLAGDR